MVQKLPLLHLLIRILPRKQYQNCIGPFIIRKHSVFKITISAGVLACNCYGLDSIPDIDMWQGSCRSE